MPSPRRIVQHALFIAALGLAAGSIVHFPLLRRFARGEFRESFAAAERFPAIRTIGLAEAQALFSSGGALFIDARAAGLFASGRVPGARNLPGEHHRGLRREAVGAPPERTLVLYGEGGDGRSGLALARRLAGLDYRDIRVFSGGWTEWTRAGLPVEGAT